MILSAACRVCKLEDLTSSPKLRLKKKKPDVAALNFDLSTGKVEAGRILILIRHPV